MALSVGHPRGTHSRYVIGCCLIPLGICGLKNNSRRITYGIGCVWGMPSLSPLSSLDTSRLEYKQTSRTVSPIQAPIMTFQISPLKIMNKTFQGFDPTYFGQTLMK